MNPAALRTNIRDLEEGHADRQPRLVHRPNLEGRSPSANPLDDGTLGDYHVHEVQLTSLTPRR